MTPVISSLSVKKKNNSKQNLSDLRFYRTVLALYSLSGLTSVAHFIKCPEILTARMEKNSADIEPLMLI